MLASYAPLFVADGRDYKMPKVSRYHPALVVLHWLLAILIPPRSLLAFWWWQKSPTATR